MTKPRALSILFGSVLLISLATPAFAGPPLVCSPFEIGKATSLPWNQSSGSYKGMRADYDLSRLNTDVVALLTPSTPVLVRMETLRRAALYASLDPAVARGLLDMLHSRAARPGIDAALARFDEGYLIETYRQIAWIAPDLGKMVVGLDGYKLVTESLEARHGDPAIAFAAALMTERSDSNHAMHVRAARAGASADALLAENINHVGP